MEIFGRKKREMQETDTNQKNIEKFSPILLSNGEIISIMSIEEGNTIQHSDGRQTKIKIVGISNTHKTNECVLLEPSKYIAFEIAKGQKIDENIIRNTIAQVLKEGYNNELCQYVGEYNQQTNSFDKKSHVVEDYITTTIEEKLKKSMEARRAQTAKSSTRETKEVSMREKLVLDTQKYFEHLKKIKKDRIDRPFLRSRGIQNINGREFYNYNGVNIENGDILKIRQLNKVGKDGSGTYLYAGYIQNTSNESDVEILGNGTPMGAYVCFEMRQRIEDIIKNENPMQIWQVLSLLSFKDENNYKNDGELHYIGLLDEYGNISRDLQSNSPAIRNIIESMKRENKENRQKYNRQTDREY